ncbi:U-box domain-containing protein 33-like [Rhodamnia argentea]|uniref:RING-type E3 ubiquitin transferase n=1 Tax=Rhodamnia argentea TaxID=178133 RepID=A0ABM3H7T6_9MYRT|nr:U-box domain-containing protein 33-like [Rhodamnia argentea]
MAVVDRIITLPEFRVPTAMPSFRGVAPELATPVFEDKIYVAVGKDEKEGIAKLVYAKQQSGGNVKICIIYVLVPSQTIPMGVLGAEMPANSASEVMLREHREKERIIMHNILDNYLRACQKMRVPAEKEYIESESVQKGIVELVLLHGIRKLIMGAAEDRRYFKKMTEIRSKKAMFVRDKADISCQIWFICDGHLICTREAQTGQVIVEVPTDAPSPTTPTRGAGKLALWKSRSTPPQRSGTAKFHPFQEILRRAFSSSADRRAVAPATSPSPDSSPSEQPNVASMLEWPDTPLEHIRSLSPHPQLIQSVYHTAQSSISNTLEYHTGVPEGLEEGVTTRAALEVDIIEGGQKDPRKLEEELERVKDQQNKVMEELCVALEQKLQLESQFAETDESRKELEQKIVAANEMLRTYRQERELLRIELDNALQKVEEVSRRKGDSSGTKYFSEFSMTEIKEAAQNFDPSLKIGEGGCGSVYRGFLRNTPAAIKVIKLHSMHSSQEFQQEVDVLSKVRHPNLITLMGACPKPCTLVYEYVPNGSLEDWLRSSTRAKQLPWQARIRIATELCSVLAFLHSCKPHSIVHGDVKPANILLDEHFGSKLSDFGICRLLSSGEQSSNNTTVLYTTDLKGTLGYMDPEILVTRELTTKFDVYSFGIILLQLLTRLHALGIANEVRMAISAGTLEDILDPLAGEWPYMLAKELAHLALRCCEMSRRNRPDLQSDVWTLLQSIGASSR